MPDCATRCSTSSSRGDRVAVHWRANGHFTGRPYQGIRANGPSARGRRLLTVEDGLIRSNSLLGRLGDRSPDRAMPPRGAAASECYSASSTPSRACAGARCGFF